MPSLEQQAQRAQQIIKEGGLRQHPAERDIIVLWGMYRGWGVTAMSKRIGGSATTVRKVRTGFHKDPSEIFRLPVMSGILHRNKTTWKCEACGLPLLGMSEQKARTHVARHFVPDMVIQLNGVMPKAYWWGS